MTCDETRELLNGFVDGEFDLRTQAEIDRHVRGCNGCTREFEGLRALRAAFVSADLRYSAPVTLRERVRAITSPAAPQHSENRPARLMWTWLGAGAAFATMFLLVWVFVFRGRINNPNLIAQEAVSSHIRSLMLNHLTDVPSTDQHMVKPWFDGKVDFSPPVTDLKSQGFPLVGGRLDALAEHPVAALVYQRRLHVINLFVWPANAKALLGSRSFIERGYNALLWEQGGWDFCAVSDLNSTELAQFALAIQGTIQK